MNKFIIAGHVGRDPEERTTPSGQKMLSFSVASNKYFKGTNTSTWYRCVFWGDNPFIANHVKKGSAVMVTGTLEPPTIYIDKNADPRVSLNVTVHAVDFLPSKSNEERKTHAQEDSVFGVPESDDTEDDGLPF